MGLADTAKSLQAQEEAKISQELAWLRKLRAFTEEWTDENLIKEIDRVEVWSKTPEGRADQKKAYLDTLEILEKGSLANFYRKVLEYAAIKQRKDRDGGGEKAIRLHWDELQKMERGIKKRFEKQRRETDGNNKG